MMARNPLLTRFLRDRAGGAAIIFAIALPALLVAASATVTYGQLTTRRAQLQLAADTAVLTAARELTLANVDDKRVISVAEAAARASLTKDRPEGTQAQPAPKIVRNDKGDRIGVEIVITETVPTAMGKLLSQPTSDLSVKAEAKLSGGGKVCMVGLDQQMKGTINLYKAAQLTAPNCGVYANSKDRESLIGDDNVNVIAGLVCSAGGVRQSRKGQTFQPQPVTDCPVMTDPLGSRPAPSYSTVCTGPAEVKGQKKPTLVAAVGDTASDVLVAGTKITDTGTGVELSPGLYCDGLKVSGGAQVRLKPGVYVFRGPLRVDDASFTGQNVGLYFEGDKASMLFDTDSTISLTAPKDGDMAGLLMFEQRNVGLPLPAPDSALKGGAPVLIGAPLMREYRIVSDNAQTLLGTIYLPAGRLIVDSKKSVADRSAYTVILARRIELFDGPNLVLNTDYSGTDVPVPKGVGPVGAKIGLTN